MMSDTFLGSPQSLPDFRKMSRFIESMAAESKLERPQLSQTITPMAWGTLYKEYQASGIGFPVEFYVCGKPLCAVNGSAFNMIRSANLVDNDTMYQVKKVLEKNLRVLQEEEDAKRLASLDALHRVDVKEIEERAFKKALLYLQAQATFTGKRAHCPSLEEDGDTEEPPQKKGWFG